MEKTARRPSTDPNQERLRQNKALWNKEVSSFINDLIHFKKTMNGWPSKFFKERSRITSPVPADPGTIIGSLAGDFQEIVNKGNAVIEEQLNYAKNRRQKQPKAPAAPTPAATAAPEAPKAPDLNQQLGRGLAASEFTLIKVAEDLEDKYLLMTEASNPISRFVTRLFNPTFGFGEAARIRRLRMTMLDNCVKAYKGLKQMQKEVVKSGKGSIVTSHKMMTLIWNYWNAVSRLLSTFKALRPGAVTETGGQIEEDSELKRERAIEEGRDPGEEATGEPLDTSVVDKIKDFRTAAPSLGSVAQNTWFTTLGQMIESFIALPQAKKVVELPNFNFSGIYAEALKATNQELGTSGSSFQEIAQQYKSKTPIKAAQLKELRKFRHQLLPGATSGSRLEVYNLIEQIKKDLNAVMDQLEAGFDVEKLTQSIKQVNQEFTTLRTMMRALYYSEKPEEASTSFM